jgi:hypothetical protein
LLQRGESIDVNQIRSVKVSRGARNIPKAFEIFTGDQTLILKPKDGKNAEEWVQCLSIVVAHSQVSSFDQKRKVEMTDLILIRFVRLATIQQRKQTVFQPEVETVVELFSDPPPNVVFLLSIVFFFLEH